MKTTETATSLYANDLMARTVSIREKFKEMLERDKREDAEAGLYSNT
jgi:hypothetical protein